MINLVSTKLCQDLYTFYFNNKLKFEKNPNLSATKLFQPVQLGHLRSFPDLCCKGEIIAYQFFKACRTQQLLAEKKLLVHVGSADSTSSGAGVVY